MNVPRPILNAAHAGAPQPADETSELFDLAGHLIEHPNDTFYVRVAGDSMNECGIFDGDILIVDRSLGPQPSDIVIARIGEDYTVKKFRRRDGRLRLVPSNPTYPMLEISDETQVCGVVRFAIHRV
jgi:DNA polymerase V